MMAEDDGPGTEAGIGLVALARTNCFEVRDPNAFTALCGRYGLELVTCGARVGFRAMDGSGIPSTWKSPETGEVEDIDIPAAVAAMLSPGQVAIFIELCIIRGADLDGWATAVNAMGEYRHIALQDIVPLARELTDRPNEVSEPAD